jgi:hypothetical protein
VTVPRQRARETGGGATPLLDPASRCVGQAPALWTTFDKTTITGVRWPLPAPNSGHPPIADEIET